MLRRTRHLYQALLSLPAGSNGPDSIAKRYLYFLGLMSGTLEMGAIGGGRYVRHRPCEPPTPRTELPKQKRARLGNPVP